MNKFFTKKILLIGIFPPPIGGVSIHLDRFYKRLRKENFNVDYFDYKKDSISNTLIRKVINSEIIHTHFSNKIMRFLSTVFFRIIFKRIIITFHGRYDFSNWLDKLSLKLSSVSIVLNKQTYEHASKIKKRHLHLAGSFLVPEDIITTTLKNEDYQLILNLKEKYSTVFCMNASGLVYDNQNREIYCGKELFKLFSERKTDALIFSDPTSNYSNFFKNAREKIPDNICILNYHHNFIEVIKLSDCLLRITTTDGDSVSVKEALYYKKNVIATNVVDRPDGTILVNDTKDLARLLAELKTPLPSVDTSIEDNFIKLTSIYTNNTL